jgi:hypothetical protein
MSMAGLPLECILMSAYALSLTLIALFLGWVAGHAHRRSLRVSTTGFTYHADRPKDQHLFPVFSDSVKGNVIYRAPASACNACPSKAACTDSNHGRQIERNLTDLEYGMKRFHQAVSLTLLALASLILVVELFRTAGLYPRIMLLVSLALLIMFIRGVAEGLIPSVIQA